jgi:hypothetical protein
MKRIYEVTFEERWTGSNDWFTDTLNVVSNGDALKAVLKAKKYQLRQSFVDDETGKTVKCVGFRFLGVKVVAAADL